MTSILELMKQYAERHGIRYKQLQLNIAFFDENEPCGEFLNWHIRESYFSFNSLPDLIEKLKQ